MIKFEHTLFALPFAVLSAFYAARGIPTLDKIIWILVAMVSARSSAMAFNRMADAKLDAQNPRTTKRAIPMGNISMKATAIFTLAMIIIFIFSSAMLNEICFYLSPVALIIILGYSYTKRFTIFSHFILGLSLAIAPIGAWLAITASFDMFPLILGTAVMFWTTGFDIIYSCEDVEFDRNFGLYSIPAKFGIRKGLIFSTILHFLTVIALVALIPIANLGVFYKIGCALITALLIYEHLIVRPTDLKKLNEAFFIVNAVISGIVMTTGLLDLFI